MLDAGIGQVTLLTQLVARAGHLGVEVPTQDVRGQVTACLTDHLLNALAICGFRNNDSLKNIKQTFNTSPEFEGKRKIIFIYRNRIYINISVNRTLIGL